MGHAETPAFHDDREQIDPQRRLLLMIIEDDVSFAEILWLRLASELVVPVPGRAQRRRRHAPGRSCSFCPRAIILDMNLPDRSSG